MTFPSTRDDRELFDPTPRPGLVVDNCRLEVLVGSGAFGAVWRAHHLTLEHPRAFKFLLRRSELTDAVRSRFLAEARHTARLSHPNVVIVHNVAEHGGLPFIHMEYLTGSSLRTHLRGGPVAVERALYIADQVLAALAAAHARGIVHRDVKPDNVMVLDGGAVKVVDFGLSLNVEANVSRLTVDSRVVLGTPLYMAPEQWRTSSVGPPADVWSAGVLLYELLSGETPFGASSLTELAAQIRHGRHVPLSGCASVARELSDLVDRMLAKEVARRFADAAEARSALRAVTGALSSAAAVPAPPTPDVPLSGLECLEPLAAEAGQVRQARRVRDGALMSLLPGGLFFMGSDHGDSDERPRHAVRLSPFLLDARPVSRRQFAVFLSLWGTDRDDEGHPLLDPDLAGLERIGMTWEPAGDEAGPVVGVTWYGAVAYARWAGARLPSEAQLESALGQLTAAQGGVPPWSALLGTVRLWCADTYDERFYAATPVLDPVNEDRGTFVSVRGRSRLGDSPDWSPSRRQFGTRHEVNLDVGFCCAVSLTPPDRP
jgi:serine/threonine protein kinase